MQITISNRQGKTYTSDDANAIYYHAREMVRGPIALTVPLACEVRLARLQVALLDSDLLEAGKYADELGLNFAWSAKVSYTVPVDPSEATNCEACQ